MASDADNPTGGLGRVVFPPDLLHRLDGVLDSLRSRIIDAAAQRARARSEGIAGWVVGGHDMAETAREFFSMAASELDRMLRKHHTRHGRARKAS